MIYKLQKINCNCPLCSHKLGELLYETNSDEVARSFFSKRKDREKFNTIKNIIEKLWRGKKCKKIRCKNCSFVYCIPFVGGDQQFYSMIYKKGEYPPWKWDYEVTHNLLKKLPNKERTSLIEIGAGNGSFIRGVSPSLIPKKMVLCFEYAKEGCKKITEQGYKCYNKNFLDAQINGKYSIICMFQVLEHMDNLFKVFNKIKKISKKKAHIFITTPCIKTILSNEQKGSILDLPPTHIGGWSKEAFEKVCEIYGFKLAGFKQQKCSLTRRFLHFGLGRFERGKLQEKSLANKIDSIKNKKIRKLMIVIFLLIKIIPYFLEIIRTETNQGQWVHLKNFKKNEKSRK